MQFMYLRRKGKKNNPGRHPIGLVGVKKIETGPDAGLVDVAVQMVHSKDRFEKEVGRELLVKKLNRDRVARLSPNDLSLSLHTILPTGFGKLLDDYTSHQEILDKLIKDEMTGGSWSTLSKRMKVIPTT